MSYLRGSEDYVFNGSGKVKSYAYSIGVRYSKTIKSDNEFYVEPQAQLNYTHFGSRDFTVGNVSVNQAGNSTSGKLGIDVGKQFCNGNLYTRLAASHTFTGKKTTYASGNAVKLTEQGLKGTWTELAFGDRYGFNTNNSVYADVTTGLSGDYQADWGVSAGFKF